ncbi:NADH-quinone oxidoreductase subunit M [Paenirhodobacter populi]|uniref:NADH-quinone oxidoreductase subunit M n=1 Tax=Paenirhodobacter populi TaxID=2306993 RepID=A0A443JVK5_9RHOB|nr:NADH-quinone oxidoreductase subunit M [Sinirhodobacter populi]RWR13330.1 NADH-quinone oxidoreductase subunit M [Sinirhodobacter populi]RWR24547.1 NADH-quinone oxidoreductase subunit M [Sinirhodobacter populi]
MENLLSIITFVPLVAATILALVQHGQSEAADRNARWFALITTIVTFLISLFLLVGFDRTNPDFQFVEEYHWILGMKYKVGVDGISVLFVVLITFLMPITVGAAWIENRRVKEYMVTFLILEGLMIGVFTALDMVLFYLFFEASLIPMFLVIGIWGGRQRIYATFKFFLYTFFGSVVMLVAMIAMFVQTGTTDITELMQYTFPTETMTVLGISIPGGMQTLLFLAFFVSFAVKVPMWPVHTWLPDAHVQAPTAGSVDLAAILLKMGGYGFLRFSLPMFPAGASIMADFIMTLSVIAIIWTSLVALMQTDMKRLIAYSSVAHMGFVTIGIFAVNQQGIDGAMFQMLSHGVVSSALFLSVGVLYERLHTREIAAYGGIMKRMPAYAMIFMFFTMANIGLPGTSGFIGEFLAITGAFQAHSTIGFFAATGVILSAAYGLWLYRRIFMGPLVKESLKGLKDLDLREKLMLIPLVVLIVALGVYPPFITDIVGPTVVRLVQNYDAAIAVFTAGQ